MSRQKRMRALALAFSILLSAGTPALAQQKDKSKKGDQQQDVPDRPRNVKTEKSNMFKKWINEDVAYIITPDEKKAWNKLQTDEEREQFIEAFWRRRDPDPDTDVNEYLEEHYERVAYANEHFAPGIRSGIEIEFVDPTGSGEYRIARNPDEKDALLMVPGAGLTLNEQLGLSSKSDRVADMGTFGYTGPGAREADSPFTRLQLYTDLQRPPQVNDVLEKNLLHLANTPAEDTTALDVATKVDFYRASDNTVMTALTIQTDNSDLQFKDVGGVQQARLNIYGRVTNLSGRRITSFEDPVTTEATPEELVTAKDRKSAYQRVLPLSPGHYKVDLIIRDINSGAQTIKSVGFEVPKYAPEKLGTSTLVLAVKLQALNDQLPGMFTIGPYKVLPNVSGTFKRGQDVGIYMQVYNAGIDQTTLRPSVDVEYVLSKDGKEVGKQAEDWRGLSDSGQRLTLARLIDTRSLAVGDYEIAVRIRDRVTGQSLSPSQKFSVIQ